MLFNVAPNGASQWFPSLDNDLALCCLMIARGVRQWGTWGRMWTWTSAEFCVPNSEIVLLCTQYWRAWWEHFEHGKCLAWNL